MGGHKIGHDGGRHGDSRSIVRLVESLGSDWDYYSSGNGWSYFRSTRLLVLCCRTAHNVPDSCVHIGCIANVLLLRVVLPDIDTSRLGRADRMVYATYLCGAHCARVRTRKSRLKSSLGSVVHDCADGDYLASCNIPAKATTDQIKQGLV